MRDDKATPTRERTHGKGPGGARMHEGGEDWGDVKDDQRARRRIDTEDEVAEASDESFPASDPPSFNPGRA